MHLLRNGCCLWFVFDIKVKQHLYLYGQFIQNVTLSLTNVILEFYRWNKFKQGSDLRDVTVTNYLHPTLDRCSYSCLAFLTSCELSFQAQPIF